MFIVSVGDATSLGILKAPGNFNADVVVGDAQAFGLGPSYGGPYAGFTACKNELIRTLPGRIVGRTLDTEGKEGYILTLQAREQHIRREKAFSNLCTNSGLCALFATVWLATLGKEGLKGIANQSLQKAHYLFDNLSKLKGYSAISKSPFYNEFVIKCKNSKKLAKALEKNGIIAGLELEKYYPELKNCILFCVTELNTKEEMDKLIAIAKKVK